MNAPEALSQAESATGPRWLEPTLLETLGPAFHTELPPQPLGGLHWVARNDALAGELGLSGWIGSDDALQLLGGNRLPAAGRTRASVYSGHQFGIWAGQLGDGRALMLGEVPGPGGPLEMQLKGSGLTPYSRMGDGRAVLRSSIREYLCSEAMHALGIPTTRALAVVGSPDPVRRETLETAAVVTRVAPSFLRFGHFEHFTHTAGDTAALQRLADTVIDRFHPECREAPQPALALLAEVSRRTARLLADWQAVGFCHGVMNTDNMSILGLTIDYGPFGFLDAFDPGHVCNHSDTSGRYAYFRQPGIAFWNLHALAHALAPLVDGDTEALQAALEPYKEEFAAAMQRRMRAKLGLKDEQADDPALADDLMKAMARDRVDFTIAWRRLCEHDPSQPEAPDSRAMRDLFIDRAAFDAWSSRYAQRLALEASDAADRRGRMQRANPKFVLRNHLAETAIRSAREGDFAEVDRLMRVLSRPFDEQPEAEAYAAFPPDWASHLEVSCSS